MNHKESSEEIPLEVKFGRRLFVLRSERLMTQEQLAEKAGISVDFLSLMERGRRAPSFRTLGRLANALDVPVKTLFEFGDELQSSTD